MTSRMSTGSNRPTGSAQRGIASARCTAHALRSTSARTLAERIQVQVQSRAEFAETVRQERDESDG